MADISDINSALPVKVVGADATGLEQTPVSSTSSGALHTNIRNATGTELATSANPLRTDPTGTTAQPVTDNGGTLTVDQSTASNLNAQVVGNVASAATDSGNPVKIGGIHTTTVPLLTDGQRGNVQLGENSSLVIVQSRVHYTAIQKAFSATTTAALTVGTSETALFLFRNPNASGVKARIFKIFVNTTESINYRFYHTPTITNTGTGLAEINQKIMTSPATAAVTAFQSPTASANGTLLWQFSATDQGGTREINLDHELIVNPNFDILVTAQAGSNNSPVSITFFWYEVP